MAPRIILGFLLALATAGCATRQGEAMPVIRVLPGFRERIALMDRYRLHDEDRKRMMARPHVWVEEVSDDEIPTPPSSTEGEPSSDAPPSSAIDETPANAPIVSTPTST